MERTIEVTEKHIEESLRARGEKGWVFESSCPVYLALKESYDGFPDIRVHRRQSYLLKDGQDVLDDGATILYHMPDVWNWIWNFDFSKKVRPIKLCVQKYQGVLRMVIAKEV